MWNKIHKTYTVSLPSFKYKHWENIFFPLVSSTTVLCQWTQTWPIFVLHFLCPYSSWSTHRLLQRQVSHAMKGNLDYWHHMPLCKLFSRSREMINQTFQQNKFWQSIFGPRGQTKPQTAGLPLTYLWWHFVCILKALACNFPAGSWYFRKIWIEL